MKQFSLRWLRRFWLLGAIALVLLTVFISLIRATFPLLNNYKGDLSAWLQAEYQLDVQLQRLDASWDKYGPALVVTDARWLSAPEQGVELAIGQTRVRLDVMKSLKNKQWVFSRIALTGVELRVDVDKIQRDADASEDDVWESVQAILLEKIDDFAIRQGRLSLYQHNQLWKQVEIEQLSWLNQGKRHQGVGQAKMLGSDASRVKFVVNINQTESSSLSDWLGQLYIQGEGLNLAPYLTPFIDQSNQLQQAQGNFEAWIDFSLDQIDKAHLVLGPSQLHWLSPQGARALSLQQGQLSFRPTTTGWQLDAQDWLFESTFSAGDRRFSQGTETEQPAQALTSAINFQAYQQGGYVIASMDKQDILPLISLVNLFTAKPLDYIESQEYQAELHSGLWQLLYHIESKSYLAHGSLAFQGHTNVVGTDVEGAKGEQVNIVGRFLASNQGGRVTIEVKDSLLALDGHFQAPLTIASLSLPLNWHYTEQGAEISSAGFILANSDLTWQGQFKLDWPRSGSPYLTGYSEASVKQAEYADRYFPIQAMGQNVYDYLQPTIAAGEVDTAKLLWHGQLDQFPYAQGDGIFQAWVPLTNTEFHFYPGWPPLSKMKVDLLFENDGLMIASQDASLMKAHSDKIKGTIMHFSPDAQLQIDAKVRGLSEDVSDYLISSPLASSVGVALQTLHIEGPISGELALTIPLNGDDAQVSGSVSLENNTMSLPLSGDGKKTPLKAVNGRFNFNQGDLSNGLVDATWQGLPIKVRFNGVEQEQAYQVNLNASADWPVAALEQQWPHLQGLNGSGQFGWRLQVDYLQQDQGDYRFNAKLHSDLTGLALELPEPFHKNSLREWPLTVSLSAAQSHYQLRAQIDNKLYFNLQPAPNDPQQANWWLHFGQHLPSKAPSQARAVTLAYRQLDIGSWLTWWQQQADRVARDSAALPAVVSPSLVKLNVNKGALWGEQLNGLSLSANNQAQGWQLQITSDKVKGTVMDNADTLDIDLQRISLPDLLWPQGDGDDEIKAWSLDQFKTTMFNCDACQVGPYRLGKVNGRLVKTKGSIELTQLSLLYGHSDIHLSGLWQAQPLQTQLKAKIQSHDVAKLAQTLGQDSPMKETSGVAEFELTWRDSPNRFATEHLNGQLSFTTNEGYIADISDKGARLFSLLSLDSIRRKLNLDFRDVFADGLYFDSIKATAKIENGILVNDDFELDAAAGHMIGKGELDLNQWQMNYAMAFYPNVTSSLPVLAAFTITPVTGLYVLLLSKIFEPVVDIITQVNFSLTGDISNPIIEEVGREQGAIELPKEVKKSYEQRITDSINKLQPRR
ncbi:YhdP family protein [Motilimonas eburnea]|uniref:YhdP family protein n=1 Tax=Motilimonas eburnea TaxID=1737488 RepID=UPI001E499801|nr:TIGR02099 family protein [Motilimonas eburnea]